MGQGVIDFFFFLILIKAHGNPSCRPSTLTLQSLINYEVMRHNIIEVIFSVGKQGPFLLSRCRNYRKELFPDAETAIELRETLCLLMLSFWSSPGFYGTCSLILGGFHNCSNAQSLNDSILHRNDYETVIFVTCGLCNCNYIVVMDYLDLI